MSSPHQPLQPEIEEENYKSLLKRYPCDDYQIGRLRNIPNVRDACPVSRQLCLDGTSACGKSTILEHVVRLAARDGKKYEITKMPRLMSVNQPNSNPVEMLGTMLAGIHASKDLKAHLTDRGPLNNFEWYVTWQLLDQHRGAGEFTKPIADTCIARYRDLANSLPYRRMFRPQMQIVTLYDSDVDSCNARRLKRGEGSDAERTLNMPIYTPIQNLMYGPESGLHALTIDLQDLRGNFGTKLRSVARFLYCLMQFLESFEQRIPLMKVARVPIPTAKRDYRLSCVGEHARRTLIRSRARAIAEDAAEAINHSEIRANVPEWAEIRIEKFNVEKL